MAAKKVDDSSVFQLKISLNHSKPPIWRRVQVRGSTTLSTLHKIIQASMGWYDYHLHEFTAGRTHYGIPSRDWNPSVVNERRIRLDQIVSNVKDRFRYEYDFGDSWGHVIVVEKILEPEAGVRYPICLAGKGACPPEDCGGIGGYYDLLDAIHSPDHPEHEMLLEWAGGPIDPEAFDLEAVNQRLKRF